MRVVYPFLLLAAGHRDFTKDMQCPDFQVFRRQLAKIFLVVVAASPLLSATDLLIHLPDVLTISRKIVVYRCDGASQKIGVPADSFQVEYINGGGNSLVIIPISGKALIFSNVASASGARYAAQQYTWWESKNSVVISSDSLTGKLQSSCRQILYMK